MGSSQRLHVHWTWGRIVVSRLISVFIQDSEPIINANVRRWRALVNLVSSLYSLFTNSHLHTILWNERCRFHHSSYCCANIIKFHPQSEGKHTGRNYNGEALDELFFLCIHHTSEIFFILQQLKKRVIGSLPTMKLHESRERERERESRSSSRVGWTRGLWLLF